MAGPGKLHRSVWSTGTRTALTICACAKSWEALQRQLDEHSWNMVLSSKGFIPCFNILNMCLDM